MPPRTVAVINPANMIFLNMVFAFSWGAMPRMLPFYVWRHVEMLNLSVSYLKDSCTRDLRQRRNIRLYIMKKYANEAGGGKKLIQISALILASP